jgi:predicted enzyme related to lactoylglutathione lyase
MVKEVKQPEGSYVTDLLYQLCYSMDDGSKQKQTILFFYLSHKGVHAEFSPAKRHGGKYANIPRSFAPPSMYLTATDSSKNLLALLQHLKPK